MFPIPHYRPLTAGEIQLVKNVFGNGIDCEKVRIHCGKFIPVFQHPHIAMTPFGTAHFPRALYENDFSQANLTRQHLFIHEMVHVWQYQLGLSVWWHGLCLAIKGGYFGNACYAYQHTNCNHLNQLNIEQQADLIADYFVLNRQNHAHMNLIQAFIDKPDDRNLLPQNINWHK